MILAGSSLVCIAQTAAELGVAQHSEFDGSTERRDPFVPIGWKRPPSAVAPVTKGIVALTTEAYIKPEAFTVSSISVDRVPLAVINGQPYAEGDSLPFLAGEKKIKLKVYSIRDGAVTLRYNDFKITCPIRLWQKPVDPGKKP